MSHLEIASSPGGARARRIAAPLRQEVAGLIREAIVTSEFKPGERLIESTLCARYDVSRTVIRETLRQLESEGLVTTVANRGPEVSRLSIDEAESLYEVRGALESLAGELFAKRATAGERADLELASQRVEVAVREGDIHALLRIKDEYYDVLLRGSRSAEIERMLRMVQARTQLLRVYSLQSPNRGEKTIAEISEITKYAVAGDSEATREACVRHVQSAATAALAEMRARRAAESP